MSSFLSLASVEYALGKKGGMLLTSHSSIFFVVFFRIIGCYAFYVDLNIQESCPTQVVESLVVRLS